MSLYPDNPPTLIPSFVCHVDILGYAQLCQNAIAASDSNAFLNKIRTALTTAYERVRESSQSWNGENKFEIKIFTDNIVVGYPVPNLEQSYGEGELGHIFYVFAEFQLGLAMEGFLVRGGIALGQHYMDEEIVFGDALIQAVKEDSNGGAPKVGLAKSAIEAVRHHLGFYGTPESSPQAYDLLEDVDGSIFINYLQGAFVAFPDAEVFYEVFEKHKNTLVDGLKEYKGVPSVRAKYEWASRYHNSVITNFLNSHPSVTNPDADEMYACAVSDAQDSLPQYLIDIESLAGSPGQLKLDPIRLGA